HEAEKQEDVARRKRSNHFRKKSSQQRCEHPVRKTSQSLSSRAALIGEYLRDQHPDHCPLPKRVGRNEGKYTKRHDIVVRCEKCPCDETQGSDVSERADIEERAAPKTINQPQSNE